MRGEWFPVMLVSRELTKCALCVRLQVINIPFCLIPESESMFVYSNPVNAQCVPKMLSSLQRFALGDVRATRSLHLVLRKHNLQDEAPSFSKAFQKVVWPSRYLPTDSPSRASFAAYSLSRFSLSETAHVGWHSGNARLHGPGYSTSSMECSTATGSRSDLNMPHKGGKNGRRHRSHR